MDKQKLKSGPRIIIFGNSGAGKSTLAKQLQEQFELEHLDLDNLAWLDSSPPQRKPLMDSQIAITQFMEKHQAWVIEGCYADLLHMVLTDANEMIFLNPGVQTCIENCKNRPWEPHKYKSKQDQDQNLAMLIEWVKQYPVRDDEFSLNAHRRLFDDFPGKKIEYAANTYGLRH